MPDHSKLWTIKETAEYLCMTTRTVDRYPDIPRIRIGRNVRYDPKAVEQWALKRKETEEPNAE